MSAPVEVKFRLVHPNAKKPTKATEGSAGFDLYAAEGCTLAAGMGCLVDTGVQLEIPPGYEGQIRPRSGLATKRGITVLNAPGTIDSDFRGSVGVALVYSAFTGRDPAQSIGAGERIAQLVIQKVPAVELVETTKLSDTQRGSGGFGSTGK